MLCDIITVVCCVNAIALMAYGIIDITSPVGGCEPNQYDIYHKLQQLGKKHD